MANASITDPVGGPMTETETTSTVNPQGSRKVAVLVLSWKDAGQDEQRSQEEIMSWEDEHIRNRDEPLAESYADFLETEALYSRNRKKEIYRFEKFLKSAYTDPVYTHHEIPPTKAKLQLSETHDMWLKARVADFLHENNAPDTLIIFYYSGHAGVEGGENDSQHIGLHLVPEKHNPRAKICFTRIQNQFLKMANMDILMIMDCCDGAATPPNSKKKLSASTRQHSGSDGSGTRQRSLSGLFGRLTPSPRSTRVSHTPARSTPVPQSTVATDERAEHIREFWQLINSLRVGRMEILAAAGIHSKAMAPGHGSFTTSMMTVLESASKSQDLMCTPDLHRKVLLGEGSREGYVMTTPILITMGTNQSNPHISLTLANPETGNRTTSEPEFESQQQRPPHTATTRFDAIREFLNRGLNWLGTTESRFSIDRS